jgi:pyridoxamine 5'-phosphate oxidase
VSIVFEPADDSLADPLPASPLPLLERWLGEARRAAATPVPDAMALATVDARGEPTVRFVLCRGFDAETGALSFFTSYESPKSRDLEASPVASVVFHWAESQRQARLTGPVARSSPEASDAYWASRARLSQIAARASRQSEPLDSRTTLLDAMREEAARFGGADGDAPVPRPDDWGGWTLLPTRVELWVGSRSRAHDRAVWERDLAEGDWRSRRLQP